MGSRSCRAGPARARWRTLTQELAVSGSSVGVHSYKVSRHFVVVTSRHLLWSTVAQR